MTVGDPARLTGREEAGVGGVDVFQPVGGPADDLFRGVGHEREVVGLVPQPGVLLPRQSTGLRGRCFSTARPPPPGTGRSPPAWPAGRPGPRRTACRASAMSAVEGDRESQTVGRPGLRGDDLEPHAAGVFLEEQSLVDDAVLELEDVERPVGGQAGGGGEGGEGSEGEDGEGTQRAQASAGHSRGRGWCHCSTGGNRRQHLPRLTVEASGGRRKAEAQKSHSGEPDRNLLSRRRVELARAASLTRRANVRFLRRYQPTYSPSPHRGAADDSPLPRRPARLPLAADAADRYRVGVAKCDITPSHPDPAQRLRLPPRPSPRASTSRSAPGPSPSRTSRRTRSLLITVDVLGIPDDVDAELAKRLAKKAGLKPERLAITATHTHTGPMLNGANPTLFGVPIPKEHQAHIDRYTAEFLDKLEQVGARRARRTCKPAKLSGASARSASPINRRTQGGPVDHDLPVLVRPRRRTGKVRAVYASYACHCVTLSNNKIGGDWAGFAAGGDPGRLPGRVALVSIGCGADQNPTSASPATRSTSRNCQGREIAAEVKRLAGNFLAPITGKLTPRMRRRIDLPLATLPTRAAVGGEGEAPTDAIGHHARVQLDKLDRGETLPTKIDYPRPDLDVRRLARDGLPARRSRGRLLAAAQEGTRRPAALGQRLRQRRAPCYIPSRARPERRRLRGRRGDGLLRPARPVQAGAGRADRRRGQGPARQDVSAASSTPTKTGGTLPLSPQQSLAAIKTKPDLAVDLVAAEPLRRSPVAIDFGPDGKLWVCEMIDYPARARRQVRARRPRPRSSKTPTATARFDKATVVPRQHPVPDRRHRLAQGRAGLRRPGHPLRRGHRRRRQGRHGREALQRLRHATTTRPASTACSTASTAGSTARAACSAAPSRASTGKTVRARQPRLPHQAGHRRDRTGHRPDAAGPRRATTGATGSAATTAHSSGTTRSTTTTCRRTRTSPYPNASVIVAADPTQPLFPLRPTCSCSSSPARRTRSTAACGLGIYRDDLLGQEYHRQRSSPASRSTCSSTALKLDAEGQHVRRRSAPPDETDARVPRLDRQLVPPGAGA